MSWSLQVRPSDAPGSGNAERQPGGDRVYWLGRRSNARQGAGLEGLRYELFHL